jgi:hypothetical protein
VKRLLELIFPKHNDGAITSAVKQVNINLEQIKQDHRRATERADRAMDESVKIAQDALRQQKDL